ncbi:hypothetical protein SAMN05443572_10785 [Myxococcus fulvus]|uniref:DUF883 domain-containing protein n=1 Tax=Myxococcus fulvus TaxID=33 RepID=A0A511T762_MYXFU|nr:hypothetical protein [Myxococcus fulvus]GEN10010.1 hypothetical protein MFU01_50470 [Myxococcus fulvus]SEU25345.1 hypothetical protein SAMN05443572_10785 [Myxococcus fulvus]
MGSGIEGEPVKGSGFYNQGPSDSGSAADLKHESAEQVKRLGGITRQRAFSTADEKKGALVEGLDELAQELESMAGQRGGTRLPQQWVGSVAGYVRKTSDTLDRSSTEELVQQAKVQLRERPGVALAGCALLGFVAARFLKA